jgi:hypothetical protein
VNWGLIWALWLTFAVAIPFAILETIAIVDKRRGNTLTATTRRWLGIDPPNKRRRIGIPLFTAALLIFAVWFGFHIDLGWWGGSGGA